MADTNSVDDSTVPSHPEYMLTTYDNPYDPFTQWDEWFTWDTTAGYNTSGLLARVSLTSADTSDADHHVAIQKAIDEIVKYNVSGVHRKVKRNEHLVAAKDE